MLSKIQSQELVILPKSNTESLDEIQTSLRKEIKTDLTKILVENQKEVLKVLARSTKKTSEPQILANSDSEGVITFPAPT